MAKSRDPSVIPAQAGIQGPVSWRDYAVCPALV